MGGLTSTRRGRVLYTMMMIAVIGIREWIVVVTSAHSIGPAPGLQAERCYGRSMAHDTDDAAVASLQAALGFSTAAPNVFQRAMQRAASTKVAAWTFQRTLYAIDRPVHRWSKGRVSVASLTSGLPVIMLTTTGAKSGQPRTMPLAATAWQGDLAIFGTNYAQEHTPGWVYNLEADPHAHVTWRDRTVDVVAEPIDDEADREELWRLAGETYVGFPKYRERITDREVRIFRLRPAS